MAHVAATACKNAATVSFNRLTLLAFCFAGGVGGLAFAVSRAVAISAPCAVAFGLVFCVLCLGVFSVSRFVSSWSSGVPVGSAAFVVCFWLLGAGPSRPVVACRRVGCSSRASVARLLWRFRAARRVVRRLPRSVLPSFPRGCLRWFAAGFWAVSVVGPGWGPSSRRLFRRPVLRSRFRG